MEKKKLKKNKKHLQWEINLLPLHSVPPTVMTTGATNALTLGLTIRVIVGR